MNTFSHFCLSQLSGFLRFSKFSQIWDTNAYSSYLNKQLAVCLMQGIRSLAKFPDIGIFRRKINPDTAIAELGQLPELCQDFFSHGQLS